MTITAETQFFQTSRAALHTFVKPNGNHPFAIAQSRLLPNASPPFLPGCNIQAHIPGKIGVHLIYLYGRSSFSTHDSIAIPSLIGLQFYKKPTNSSKTSIYQVTGSASTLSELNAQAVVTFENPCSHAVSSIVVYTRTRSSQRP